MQLNSLLKPRISKIKKKPYNYIMHFNETASPDKLDTPPDTIDCPRDKPGYTHFDKVQTPPDTLYSYFPKSERQYCTLAQSSLNSGASETRIGRPGERRARTPGRGPGRFFGPCGGQAGPSRP